MYLRQNCLIYSHRKLTVSDEIPLFTFQKPTIPPIYNLPPPDTIFINKIQICYNTYQYEIHQIKLQKKGRERGPNAPWSEYSPQYKGLAQYFS